MGKIRTQGNPSSYGCGAFVLLAIVAPLAVAVLCTVVGVISW